MRWIERLQNILKSSSLLGGKTVAQYALYQIGLRTGYLKARTRQPDFSILRTAISPASVKILPDLSVAELKELIGNRLPQLIQEADDVAEGKVILFDALPAQLDLSPHSPLLHWSDIERGKYQLEGDIKLIWEPARLGWAFALSRAFFLSNDARYLNAFRNYLDAFKQLNPPYLGSNWTSGQEAALRILALSFAHHLFSQSDAFPNDLLHEIRMVVAVHAQRIPPTLCYARSQRNNHLISEALGLYTAGVLLEGYKSARKWRRLGWKIFNQAIVDQIAPDGTYIQHSANYHRLMLDEALWMAALSDFAGEPLPERVRQKLAASTESLFSMLDPVSGCSPNLGHQDGSNVLPLSKADHLDYRPTLQAAGRLFLKNDLFKPGPWDEKACWLGIETQKIQAHPPTRALRLGNEEDWASMRAVRYRSRPAHADQLHVEIWHQGHNLAMDAGTYMYNAPEPWCNALRSTRVHNTLTVDGLDQMLPTSRFMWLDWANAEVSTAGTNSISARHDGYRKLGVIHQRTLRSPSNSSWEIRDEVLASPAKTHAITLHWLLPDLPFNIDDHCIHFSQPAFVLKFSNDRALPADMLVIRAGALIHGKSDINTTIYGWFSPTYGVKHAALSVLYTLHTDLPIAVFSHWNFLKK